MCAVALELTLTALHMAIRLRIKKFPSQLSSTTLSNMALTRFESSRFSTHFAKETGLINYDEVDKLVDQHKPKLIITGASAYPRDWDYKRFREAADRVGALLMSDIAHIAGIVASQECNDPFR